MICNNSDRYSTISPFSYSFVNQMLQPVNGKCQKAHQFTVESITVIKCVSITTATINEYSLCCPYRKAFIITWIWPGKARNQLGELILLRRVNLMVLQPITHILLRERWKNHLHTKVCCALKRITLRILGLTSTIWISPSCHKPTT